MRPTVIDIAAAAGVSRTTVSNVMNRRDKYTPEVRDRVLAAARELGYTRNMAAKTLVDHRSNLIGLVLPSYMNSQLLTKSPFYNLIIDGIDDALRATGRYDLLIHCAAVGENTDAIREWAMLRSLDGLILVGEFPDAALRDLDERALPMVLIDAYECALDSPIRVNTDDEYGGFLAGRYLVSRGAKKAAVCSTDIGNSLVNQRRLAGLKRALDEAGLECRNFEAANNLFEGGLDIARKIAEYAPDSVFAMNDVLAAGLMKGLVKEGIRIPEDLRMVGFDNLEICSQITPELTTIDQDIFGKATLAIKLLLEAIGGGNPPRRVVLPVKLVERNT